MKPIKTFLGNETVRKFLCWLGSLYILLVAMTGRWRVINADIPERFFAAGKPFILAFWHGRLLMMPHCWQTDKTIYVLISLHRDGRLIADTIERLGVRTIAGSSSKGGASALRAMVKALKGGEYIGITPDGPRGPRMRASDGIISLARLANVPVIPIAHSSRPRKVLGNWDRFVISLPFARHVIHWGDPIKVPHTSDKQKLEDARRNIEDNLNQLTAEADRLCGHDSMEAADPA